MPQSLGTTPVLTISTLSDDDIRELLDYVRREPFSSDWNPLLQWVIDDCNDALRPLDPSWNALERVMWKNARYRCGEMLMALRLAYPLCDFRDAHDPATDTPTGNRCGKLATHRIEWEDNQRYSFGCSDHIEIDETATVKPSRIVSIRKGSR